MKRNKITNLLTYYLILQNDELKYYNMDYIFEKYFKIFKEKPNNIDCKSFYLSIKNEFTHYFAIERDMGIWGITVDDENFDIYFFTYYLVVMVNFNPDYTVDSERSDKINRLNKIIRIYNQFFKDFNSIIETDKSYLAHQVLRDEMNKYIEKNNRLFSLLKIKENIVRNKDI